MWADRQLTRRKYLLSYVKYLGSKPYPLSVEASRNSYQSKMFHVSWYVAITSAAGGSVEDSGEICCCWPSGLCKHQVMQTELLTITTRDHALISPLSYNQSLSLCHGFINSSLYHHHSASASSINLFMFVLPICVPLPLSPHAQCFNVTMHIDYRLPISAW